MSGSCSQASSAYGPPSATEQTALANISAFLDGQTGLAAECASVSSFEGDYNGGSAEMQGIPQYQTCKDNGAGACAATGTAWGIEKSPSGATTASNIRNCTDPNLASGSRCIFFSYPGDSFAQTGDYSWDAVTGHTQYYSPNTNTGSIYKAGVLPLISEVSSLDTSKLVAPTPYTGSPSAAQLAARPMIVAELTSRSVKDNTAGKANILYLAGHNQSTGVAGTKVMLETLLQLGISTLPPIVATVEVSRNSPIAATIDGSPAIVQGTFEFITSSSTPIVVPTFSSDADAATFKFPFTKGHLRARTTASIYTTATGFAEGTAVFDAAYGIPDANYSGCGTYYTALCRTVFTTIAQGAKPALHYLRASESATLGPLMAPDLTTAHQQLLIQRVLAGDNTLGLFRPALGGVDRSTVAIIEPSALVNSTRPLMAYFGADDGMLHAVCMEISGPCDFIGRELWAYLPRTELSTVRYNTARIDGSPHVIDAYGDFLQTGQRSWKTLLFFQTGTGDTTGNDRKPAVYALDISDPAAPAVVWEYSLADTGARNPFELGVGLTLSAGRIANGVTSKTLVFAQTNNAGTAGSGDVVTAINAETGLADWQQGYAFTTTLRSGGTSIPSLTGVPGGAVAVDKIGTGYVTDVVWGTLYGDVWRADPATGISKDGAGKPLFRFSTDNHPIGAKPAIYAKTAGGTQYAVITTGGYVDTYPNDTNWSPAGTTNYAIGINLNTPVADATINENKGATDIAFKFAFGANEKGIAQATVVNSQIYVTTDTADTNDNTNPGAYGTGGASGHVYRIDFSGASPTIGTSVVVEGGATSVINSGLGVYSGSSDQQSRLGTDAANSTKVSVDPQLSSKISRKLWLRTQ